MNPFEGFLVVLSTGKNWDRHSRYANGKTAGKTGGLGGVGTYLPNK